MSGILSLSKKKVLAALLAGTVLAGGLNGCESDPADGPVKHALPETPLSEEVAKTYPARKTIDWKPEELCFQPAVAGKTLLHEWSVFRYLTNTGGDFTRPLLSFAAAADIHTCLYDSASIASTFVPDLGIARVHDTGNSAYSALQAVHGLVHGHQFATGKLAYDTSWSAYSRLMQHLAAEATATAAEFVTALEAEKKGQKLLSSHLDGHLPDGWKAFRDAFLRESSTGAAENTALEKAASAAVNHLLRSPEFISSHKDKALDAYFLDIRNGAVRSAGAEAFGPAQAQGIGAMTGGFNLARYADPPPREALETLAPEVARMVSLLEKEAVRQVHSPAIARKIDETGGRYSFTQAATRVLHSRQGGLSHSSRPRDLSSQFAYCAQADYRRDQVPENSALVLWENLQTFKKGAVMGQELYDFSAKNDIFHCYYEMNGNLAGEWTAAQAIVRLQVAGDASPHDKLVTQAHELIHGLQESYDLKVDFSWTIADFQMHRLAFEAAARAGSVTLALELAKGGFTGPLLEAENSLPALAEAAKAALKNTESAGGSLSQALEAAGAAAWYAQFGNQHWLDHYNQVTLGQFIKFLAQGSLRAPADGYTVHEARATGRISEDFNLTRGLTHLPSADQRFGKNTKMQQAFEYAHLWHLGQTLGWKNQRYLQELVRQERKHNPYLGVDLRLVAKSLSHENNELNALDMMNCYVPATAKCYSDSKPFDPGPHLLNLRQ